MKLGHHDLILAEDLLMQCARAEAGSLAYALAAMLKYPCRDKNHEKSRQRFMTEIIQEHAPQRHSSEVAWALWAMLAHEFRINKGVSSLVAEMNDSVCALLLLHARAKGLVRDSNCLDALRQDLDRESLYGSRWMLAYEAARKGWFRFRGSSDFIATDPNFALLRTAGVSFYDTTKTVIKRQVPITDLLSEDESDEVDEYISRIAISYEEDDWWSDEDDDVTE
jgi:hypothetical protein